MTWNMRLITHAMETDVWNSKFVMENKAHVNLLLFTHTPTSCMSSSSLSIMRTSQMGIFSMALITQTTTKTQHTKKNPAK